MDKTIVCIIVLIILAFVLGLVYNSSHVKKESFKEEKKKKHNYSFVIPLAEKDKSCKNDIKDKSYVSVAEFMAGERYKCYN